MKKTLLSVCVLAIAGGFTACNDSSESTVDNVDTMSSTTVVTETTPAQQYVDLGTGQPLDVRKDESKGYMVNASTGEPVDFYVDVNTNDTFFGKTGTVVNNAIVLKDNKYELDVKRAKWDGKELKIVYADGSKEKIEGDEYKYKSADGKTKVKIDASENQTKVKTPGSKVKTEDGETKVK